MRGNKVIKNASWIIACRIAQAVLNLIISMITARYLGPSNYGLISYASSLAAFVTPVACLGMNHILVQETIQSPDEEGEIFGTSMLISTCASVLCMIGIGGFVSCVNAGEKETILVCILYSTILLLQAVELVQYWFQAHYLSKYFSIISLCAYFVVSLYKVFLLCTGKNIYWFAISNAIDHLLIAVALIITYYKLGGKKLKFSFSAAKRMINRSRYYIVSSMMVTVFAQTDKVMLTLMLDEAATGFYSAAVTCAGMTSFVFSAIIDSARPAIFEEQRKRSGNVDDSMGMLYCVIIYLSLAQSIVMTLLAKPIVLILYGASYEPAINALRIVVWYTTFSYMGSVRNIWILAKEKQKYLWIINLSGATLNVALNSVMIPYMGVSGAALASLITQFFTNYILGYLIKPISGNNLLIHKGLNISKMIRKFRNKLV